MQLAAKPICCHKLSEFPHLPLPLTLKAALPLTLKAALQEGNLPYYTVEEAAPLRG